MKQFIVDRHTAPSTPTLEQVPTERIPTYESLADAEADLTNLAAGQIIATTDEGASELLTTVDAVEAGNIRPVTSNAVYEYLQPEIIADETLTAINATSVRIANHFRIGKLHSMVVAITNASGTNIGTLNPVIVCNDCGYRPKLGTTAIAVNLQNTQNLMAGRVALNTSGNIVLAESIGLTSGSNEIRTTLIWAEE